MHTDIRGHWRKRSNTHGFFQMDLPSRSVGVVWPAAVVPAGLLYSSGPLNSCLRDPERVSEDSNSWSSWTHEGGRRVRDEEERDSPFSPPPHTYPPFLTLAPCAAILHFQNPFPWPPRMKIPGLQPKYWNSKSIQNNTQIHTLEPPPPPSLTKLPPIAGPFTHLVSIKPNPCKAPSPLPTPIYPPSICTYLPPSFPFFP